MSLRKPLVLAYHGVADAPRRDDPHGLFTRPEALARHIAALRRWGYRFVTFGDLARALPRAEGLAAITFDDGFADNLHQLVPVLKRTAVPATVFVASDLLGQPHPDHPSARLLREDELRGLAQHVEIGAHSARHVDLTTVPESDASDELVRSRSELRVITGQPIDVLAYPFGRTSPTVKRLAAAAGYRAACGVSGEGSWEDRLHLPRQDMTNGDGVVGLWLKREGWYEPLVARRPFQLVRALALRLATLR